MSRNFKNSKVVVSYLYKKYGKLHGQTIEDEIYIIENIKRDHTQEELKMMKRRLNGSLDVIKESNALFYLPITIMLSFLTVMSTIIITMINSNTNYAGKAVDLYKDEITKEEFMSMYDYSSLFDLVMSNISIAFFTMILFWAVVTIYFIARFRNRKNALILIEESIDLSSEEKHTNTLEAP
ncbi:hypothetical protein CHH91_04670 [Virgibacillus sp. 7505]|uniref:hypothetical protein n=1 Tax=Virgibacillus sp. 7505 TaxID=2022548 RepID=UPI000BA5B9CF|nr:hypothetical protein [Virgibacillus sp. 7505]PAE17303.1 hypothetical protein CHH91_04670 [Virgibacillus sp. 7505]